jgi:hypothetical protein
MPITVHVKFVRYRDPETRMLFYLRLWRDSDVWFKWGEALIRRIIAIIRTCEVILDSHFPKHLRNSQPIELLHTTYYSCSQSCVAHWLMCKALQA